MTRSIRGNRTPPVPSSANDSGHSTVPMTLFVPLAAPQLKSTSHAALVQWRKLRREYEEEVAMRCNNDAEKIAEVLVSVKKSFNKRLLEVWCEFDWDVDIETVSDEFLLTKVDEIISSVKNNSAPDVAALFKENVVLDMAESGVKERVMQFFAKSREFIEEQGWQEFFTRIDGLRLKCKLLVDSLQPRSLRNEVATIVKYQSRSAKEDEKELFKLILTKALEQERDYQRRKRSRSKDHGERKKQDKCVEVETSQSSMTSYWSRRTLTRSCVIGPAYLLFSSGIFLFVPAGCR